MRIWINNPFDNVPGEGGRPHRYMFLAQALSDAGHEVVFWSSDFSHPKKQRRVLKDVQTDYRVVLLPTRPYVKNVCWERVQSHRDYARCWQQTAEAAVRSGAMQAPQIILTSMPPLETGLAAQALRRTFGCRLVVDVQDAWPETFYRLLPVPSWMRSAMGAWLFAAYRNRAKQVYTQADWVTGVAETYLALARSYGAQAVSPRPFYLGTQIIATAHSKPDAAARSRAVLQMIYVGVIGRMHDLATVIQCVCQDTQVMFHIAGAGPDEERLKRLASGHPNIIFHGYLAEPQLNGILDTMDVGVLPMSRDSYVAVPNKLIDYAAHGLPILSSLQGEASVLLERYQAGIAYCAGDVESLRRGIDQLRQHADLRKLLRQGALGLAAEQFDAKKIYAAFVRELEEIGHGLAE